jgi:hypothetical protein
VCCGRLAARAWSSSRIRSIRAIWANDRSSAFVAREGSDVKTRFAI